MTEVRVCSYFRYFRCQRPELLAQRDELWGRMNVAELSLKTALLHEAEADLSIRAAAKRAGLAEADVEGNDEGVPPVEDVVDMVVATVLELRARVAELEAAMKPFAKLVETTSGRIPVERLSAADWHALVKALRKPEEPKP